MDTESDNDLNEVILQRNSEKCEDIVAMKDVDIKETYLKLIFEPYRFAKSTICKSLSVIPIKIFSKNIYLKLNINLDFKAISLER